jgi:hypothetical protein
MKIVVLIIFAFIVYYFLIKRKEAFETNQSVILKTNDGKYVSICNNKHLCLVQDENNAKSFSIFKFADDLLALENQGYYIASCFGDNCTDIIKVDSFNPYAPNTKLKLVPNGNYFKVELYDGQYWGINSDSHIVTVKNKEDALDIVF